MIKSKRRRLFFNLALGLAALFIFILRFSLSSEPDRSEVGDDGAHTYYISHNSNYPQDYRAAFDFMAMGEIPEAEKIYRGLVEKEPHSPDPFIGLAGCRIESDDYEKAREFYEKALEIDPEYIYAVVGLGFVYNELKDYTSAAKTFRKALVIDRKYPKVHEGLIVAYSYLGVKAKACYHLERFKELAPDSSYIDDLEDFVNDSFSEHERDETESNR